MCIRTEIAKPEVRRRLTDLYRLPGFQTLASIAPHPSRPGAVVLRLRRLKKIRVCSCCSRISRRRHDSKLVLVRAMACQGLEVWLEYEEWRVKCPTTGKASEESIPGILLTRRFTEALADNIGGYADRTQKSVLEASQALQRELQDGARLREGLLGPQTEVRPRGESDPDRRGRDRLGRMGWRVVVSDLDAGRPIWIGGKDRSQENFEAFFLWLGEDKYKLITLCVMDMWRPYRAALRKFCPTADVVFDKFHVVAKMSEAMDAVRRSEYARLNGEQRKFIKGQRFNLLANRGSLSRTGREELAQTFKANRRLYTAYLLKEDFDRLWSYKSEAWMRSSGFVERRAQMEAARAISEGRPNGGKPLGRNRVLVQGGEPIARIRRRAEQPDTQDPGPRLRLHGHRAHGSQDTDLHAPRRSAFDS